MKKIYFAPKTVVVKIDSESSLLSVSGGDSSVNSVSISPNDYDSDDVTILSRRGGNLWDGDEE